jgi:putative tryptophan/tyrosine transport system substrate-binding protein
MQRRQFITLLGGAAMSAPRVAKAQPAAGKLPRVGVLMAHAESDPEAQARVAAFRGGLLKLGWIDNRTVRIETRWATDVVEKIKPAAQELVASQPDLILSSDTPTTEALLRYTRTIPIVFATVADPVGSGFVASLARPGGNVTGFANLEGSIAGKWLELLKEIAPRITRAAFLFNPATSPFAEIFLDSFRTAAASLAVEATVVSVGDSAALETAIVAHAGTPSGGFVVVPSPFMSKRSTQIIALAARFGLPAVYPFRYYAEAGGLLAYGNDQADNYRRAADYADRILKGSKPSELPVQAPVKFELTVNLKTAKALGLDVSRALLQQAETVIE